MTTDNDELIQLNMDLGQAEARGDREWLSQHIAPQLAFLRADGKTIDDRASFLTKVSPSAPRETQIISIGIHGDRAMVGCLVTVQSQTQAKTYHNLRLFVRHEGIWKLLGWANEPV
jgi:hypothetical protein